MIPYFLNFAVISVLALFQLDRYWLIRRKVLLFFSLFGLTIFSGLRSEKVGADYDSYKEFFYQFEGLFSGGLGQIFEFEKYFFEPGFAALIVVVRTFTDDNIVFFLVVSSVTSWLMAGSLLRLTPYPLLAVLVFYSYDFFTNYMVAIRFGIAVALSLYFIVFVSERRHGFAILSWVVACLFHTSALILFIPYVFSFFALRRINVIIATILALVIGSLELGTTIFTNLLPGFIPRAESAVTYIASSKYGESLGFLGFVNVKYLLIVFAVLFFWRRIFSSIPYFKMVLVFFVSGMLLRIAFHDVGFIIGRTSALLGTAEILLVPGIVLAIFGRSAISWLLLSYYSLIHLFFILMVRGYNEYSSSFIGTL
jgi:hypothetical protein